MAANGQSLVSVVTPVYNGEPFLNECIESVLSQTYDNWDYTIVNNCSTDGTAEIIRRRAAGNPRIRVVTNDTCHRVIENHNIAFRQISPGSTYCKVVAADDRLLPRCLEEMVALAEAHPSVAIVGAYGLRGDHVLWEGLPCSTAVQNGREACRARLLGGPYVFGTPTSVLYRSEIVRSRPAFYNESNLHSDSEVCLEFLGERDFGFIHQILTLQGTQEDSLTSYSVRFQTYLPWVLYELIRYGPRYLGEEELRSRIREHLRAYYRYLGAQAFRRRGTEFWRFHREKLAGLGRPMGPPRLALSALGYGLDLLLNPKRTAEELARRLRRTGPGTRPALNPGAVPADGSSRLRPSASLGGRPVRRGKK